jgi:prophage regulatory protein
LPIDGHDRNLQSLNAAQLVDALLRIRTVGQATGLSAATIYRKLAAGEFPTPVRLGSRCTRWKAADVRAWIQSAGVMGAHPRRPSNDADKAVNG